MRTIIMKVLSKLFPFGEVGMDIGCEHIINGVDLDLEVDEIPGAVLIKVLGDNK